MPKGPQGQKRARPYILVVGILALTDAIFGPSIQAWYKTMQPEVAKAIGVGIIFAIMILASLIGLHLLSRKPDV
jgi:hypothetical protein